MATLRQLAARLRAFFRGGDLDRDFAHEMQAHLEMATEDNIRRGMTPDEARRQARPSASAAPPRCNRSIAMCAASAPSTICSRTCASRSRLMRKERWFSAAAIAAIALGIGANTLGFTIINAAFIRGFNFERAEELHADLLAADTRPPAAVVRARSRGLAAMRKSFAGIGASSFGAINISDDHAAPEQTQGVTVTANLFDVLRQQPLLGRSFVDGEDRPRRRARRHHQLRPLDATASIAIRTCIGRILRINGSPATIIGVMPEQMKFGENDGSELWVPFIPTEAQLSREVRVLSVFGRLAPRRDEAAGGRRDRRHRAAHHQGSS